jgi:GNAT superfamily N-acetyltransferase
VTPPHRVVVVAAADTHALRREVLRSGTPTADVEMPEDALPDTFHLGVRDGDRLIAVATFAERSTPLRPDRHAIMLRGMAVDPSYQGTGVGRTLLLDAIARLRTHGARTLWANARDTALGFYESMGMTAVGPGFVSAETALPHHVVIIDLD